MPYVDPTLYNALLQSKQGGLTELTGGHRVYPACNCCISGNTVGVYKDPVPILDIDNQDVCTYESVSVSFSSSFSASSTLQLWSVDWGDGYTSNGVWPPAASVSHPAGGYILPGNYVIILTITDLLGATASAAVDVYVDDCWAPMGWFPGQPPDVGDLSSTQLYIGERWGGQGHYTSNITASPPSWTTDNHGLNLERTIVMPTLTGPRFFGYGDGIWEYTPLPIGAGAWVQKLSEAQLATKFGHGADYWWATIGKMVVTVNPAHEEWMWAGCYIAWTDGGGDDHVSYGILYTTDAWSHTQFARIVLDLEEGVDMDDTGSPTERCEIAYDEHGDQLYMLLAKLPERDIFDVATTDGWWRLYWSQDYGFTWQLAQSETYTWGSPYYSIDLGDLEQALWVPWGSDDYNGGTVYWSICMLQYTNLAWDYLTVPLIYYSHAFALTRVDISSDADGEPGHALNILHGPYNSIHRVYGAYMIEDSSAFVGEVWTFRGPPPAYGWSLFNSIDPPSIQDCSDLLVMRQNGYALMVCVSCADPYRMTATGEVDCASPGADAYDFTWVET